MPPPPQATVKTGIKVLIIEQQGKVARLEGMCYSVFVFVLVTVCAHVCVTCAWEYVCENKQG